MRCTGAANTRRRWCANTSPGRCDNRVAKRDSSPLHLPVVTEVSLQIKLTLVRGEGEEISFRVTDGGASVPVVYTGILPDLFKEGEGMVGQGRYVNGTFEAIEILAKHDETYMPKEVIDALKEQGVYQEPGES